MLLKKIIQILISIAFVSGLSGFVQSQDRGVGVNNTQKRLALVIGNSNYKEKNDYLPNPVNDAKAMEQTLKNLGFEVILGLDADKAKMKSLIREFGEKLAKSKAVGLVFYAGHGVAVDGTNYLIPTDAEIPTEDEVDDAAIPVKFLLDKMELAENPLNMLFLDACRNNPFSRKWRTMRDKSANGGLTKIDTQGTMIFYATEYGKTAADGKDANSPFTKSLIKNLALPNVEFERMFRSVINDVLADTKGLQKPWKEGAYAGEDFFFKKTEDVGQVKPKPISGNNIGGINQTQIDRTSVESQNTSEFTSFSKIMNIAFAKDYESKTVRTKVQFLASGQTENWIFGAIPQNLMKGKVPFRVYANEQPNDSNVPFGSIPPHIFIDKAKSELIFELKKGDFIILTGSTAVGTLSYPNGQNYTQIIFLATSIEVVK